MSAAKCAVNGMDISAWLRGLGLECYEQAFRENAIDEAIPAQAHAKISEVLGGELGQDCLIDRVFPECLLVAFQAEAAQPDRDIHGIHRTLGRTHPLDIAAARWPLRYRAPSVESPAD